MASKEIIFNLWYLTDETKVAYSLKAKAYVYDGPDEAKVIFLKSRANLDFEIAKDYFLPENQQIIYSQDKKVNAIPVIYLSTTEGIMQAFNSAFNQIEKELSKMCNLPFPNEPLFVLTPLYLNENLKVVAYV